MVDKGRETLFGKSGPEVCLLSRAHSPGRSVVDGLALAGEPLVDTGLPFGLRSGPKIFTAVADTW